MVLVRYVIALPGEGDGPPAVEPEGALNVELADGEKLTRGRLRAAWPFTGDFWYRAHVPTQDGYVYLDLVEDASAVPVLGDGAAWIRALPLFTLQDGSAGGDFASTPAEYYAAQQLRAAAICPEPWSAARFPPSAPTADATPLAVDGGGDGAPTPPRGAAGAAADDTGDYWSSVAGGGEGEGDDARGGGDGGDDGDLRPTTVAPTGQTGFRALLASAQRVVEKAVDRAAAGAAAVVDKATAAAERAVAASEKAPPPPDATGAPHAQPGVAPAATAVPAGERKAGGGGSSWLGNLAKAAKSLALSASGGAAGATGGDRGAGGPGAGAVGDAADDAALVTLQALRVQYATAFRPAFPPHESLLERLWAATPPGRLTVPPDDDSAGFGDDASASPPFIRVGPQWTELGFQGDGPAADLRSGGLLGLHALVHLAEEYPSAWAALLERQSPSRAAADGRPPDSVYPVAAALLTLSTRLAHAVGLDGAEAELGRPRAGIANWSLFASHDAFYELVVLAARTLDDAWRARASRSADFGTVLASVEVRAREWLGAGVGSVDELRAMAAARRGGSGGEGGHAAADVGNSAE